MGTDAAVAGADKKFSPSTVKLTRSSEQKIDESRAI